MNRNIRALVTFSLVFAIVYLLSLWYASRLQNVSSFTFGFEKDIPFIPWTIIPYLSSGVFFCAVFFVPIAKKALDTYLKRVLLMTVLAGAGFILMPLKFSHARPESNNLIFGFLFGIIDYVDDPFNQAPSLHVAFAFAFWTVFQHLKKWRMVVAVWLILVALSTLTTYQHHLIDVLTGSILAHIAFIIFPSHADHSQMWRTNRANYYYLAGWCTITATFMLSQFYGFNWLNLLWPASVMFIIGYRYQRNKISVANEENGLASSKKRYKRKAFRV